MPKATMRAKARILLKTPKARDPEAKSQLPRVPDLDQLGKRLERLSREKQLADGVRAKAGARFEMIMPKLTSMDGLPDVSATFIWDSLLYPPNISRPISIKQHWMTIQCLFDSLKSMPFAKLKAAAEKSGYATAAARVKSLEGESHDLASRVLSVQAATLNGARSQALALLALGQVRYGPGLEPNRLPRDGVAMLVRSVIGLSDTREARP